jgi:hypothetical protein
MVDSSHGHCYRLLSEAFEVSVVFVPFPMGGPNVWSQSMAFSTGIVLENSKEAFIGILGLAVVAMLFLPLLRLL